MDVRRIPNELVSVAELSSVAELAFVNRIPQLFELFGDDDSYRLDDGADE